MNTIVFVLVSVAVATLIGGITNHLAIKMLFHPRSEVRLFGRRLPFTPGLIPKRKDEISRSLGTVVADYLVTSHGLSRLLQKTEFRRKLEDHCSALLEKWAGDERTLEQAAVQWGLAENEEKLRADLFGRLQSLSEKALRWIWREKGWSSSQLGGIVPGWSPELKRRLSATASDYAIEALKAYLRSVEGDLMIRSMTARFTERSGGLLGTLAGLFMDEDKIAQKVKMALFDGMDSPAVRQSVEQLIDRGINRMEGMTLSELVEHMTDLPAEEGMLKIAADFARWESRVEEWGKLRTSDVLRPVQSIAQAWIPAAVNIFLRLAEANMERIFTAINLPGLVKEQVDQFPVERLEQIILSVSGKEFRAITWLGALLGAIIGLVQALLLHGYGTTVS